MRDRCQNPKNSNWHNYGGRGITLCPEWETFEVFQADIKRLFGVEDIPKPLSIDRVNNDGNYEPGNIRLATCIEQSNNKRTNIRIEHEGRTQTLAEWCRELGLNPGTIYTRHKKSRGERVLSKPIKKVEHPGVTFRPRSGKWVATIKKSEKLVFEESYSEKRFAVAARTGAADCLARNPESTWLALKAAALKTILEEFPDFRLGV